MSLVNNFGMLVIIASLNPCTNCNAISHSIYLISYVYISICTIKFSCLPKYSVYIY
ncbi:hypothetical protein THIOM_005185 [Candidatus Thiomargarita nelsonii]|uniref:Uncharacterized protein n=1 Tax=Candidatus Thiomargarita nelsonii TaxID=1003181 RepID=A0A176RTY7_9GAMM|nr:hypothetical protein THIOM_005185 [Candidatus Thiomargarita nelsonii]